MADGEGRNSSGSGSVGIALGSMGLLALKDEACEPYEKKKEIMKIREEICLI